MSSPNQLPAHLRYLKARVQPLTQPVFLLSTVVLGSLIVAGWQYLRNPNLFSVFQPKPSSPFEELKPKPTLSADELAAIGVDIDSSNILIKEFDPANALSSNTVLDNDFGQSKSGKSATDLTTGLLGQNSPPTSTQTNPNITSPQKQNTINPFAKSVQDSLNFNPLSGVNSASQNNSGTDSSGEASGSNEPFNLNPNSLNSIKNRTVKPTSALQEAMNRTAAEKSASTQESDNLPTNVQSQNLPNYPNSGVTTVSPATGTGATGYNGTRQFNYNYPPTNVPGVSNYNGAGQPTYNYPPVTGAGVSGYNGAGQPTYNYPPTTGAGVSGYNGYPATNAPTNYSNPGQYSTQTPNNGVPNTPSLNQSGLQRSQLSGGGRR